MSLTGWPGVAVSIGIFVAIFVAIARQTQGNSFAFERSAGDFEKLLLVYLDIAKFILSLAAGGIVVIISSTALGSSKKLPAACKPVVHLSDEHFLWTSFYADAHPGL
jgi:hypothetical protein